MPRHEPSHFVHLHLHTHYSLLDSTISIPELVQQVSNYEMPAVAITDHGNVFGAFQFHKAAIKRRPSPGHRMLRSMSPRRPPGAFAHSRAAQAIRPSGVARGERSWLSKSGLVGERGFSQRFLPQAEDFEGDSRRACRRADRSLGLSLGRGRHGGCSIATPTGARDVGGDLSRDSR